MSRSHPRSARALLLSAALFCGGAGFAAEPGSTGTLEKPMTRTGTAMSAVPFDELGLALRLHAENQREIMLGKLTLQKARTPEAKEVARMVIADHQKADAKLLAMAKKKGWTLIAPQPVTEEERKRMEMLEATTALLKTVSRDEYDSLYLSALVANHDHALTLVRNAARKFGGKTHEMLEGLAPELEKHRTHAWSALGTLRKPGIQGVGGSGVDDASDGDQRVEHEPNKKKKKHVPAEDKRDLEDGKVTNDALGGKNDPL